MKDVPTKKSEEVFASDMVQKLRRRLVVMKDVPTMQGEEEEDYAVGMVPKGRITSADMKDAQILLSKEEFVSDMVQNLRSAQVKRYTCRHEGCTNIVQRGVCIRHGAQVLEAQFLYLRRMQPLVV